MVRQIIETAFEIKFKKGDLLPRDEAFLEKVDKFFATPATYVAKYTWGERFDVKNSSCHASIRSAENFLIDVARPAKDKKQHYEIFEKPAIFSEDSPWAPALENVIVYVDKDGYYLGCIIPKLPCEYPLLLSNFLIAQRFFKEHGKEDKFLEKYEETKNWRKAFGFIARTVGRHGNWHRPFNVEEIRFSDGRPSTDTETEGVLNAKCNHIWNE